jgi:hypothetical protein
VVGRHVAHHRGRHRQRRLQRVIRQVDQWRCSGAVLVKKYILVRM